MAAWLISYNYTGPSIAILIYYFSAVKKDAVKVYGDDLIFYLSYYKLDTNFVSEQLNIHSVLHLCFNVFLLIRYRRRSGVSGQGRLMYLEYMIFYHYFY